MDSGLPIRSFLALNRNKYVRETVRVPRVAGTIHITTNLEAGSTDLLHYHDNTHLSFILRGGIIDRRGHSETERPPGELLFFNAGEPHQSIYRVFPAAGINLELGPSFFRDNSVTETSLSASVAGPGAKLIMLNIYKELRHKDDFSDHSIELLILSLIRLKDTAKRMRPAWIDKVVELLNDNWNAPLSLNDLAAAANVHPVTISKHFPKFFSCTLGEYRRRLRIERSLTLIKTSSLSLTEVAYHCGFSDQSHFTRTFKHMTGFLPCNYKIL